MRLTAPVYINESLTWYYSKLRYIAKQLCQKNLLAKTWVSGHKVKVVRNADDRPSIIQHEHDFIPIVGAQALGDILSDM